MLVTTAADEQLHLHLLRNTLGPVDELVSRIGSPQSSPKCEPGTTLAADDRLSHPFEGSHASARFLTTAVDHIHALRRSIDGCTECDPTGMTFQIAAHWPLLRAALENAATSIWLLGPNERPERLTRTFRLQAANILNSDAAWSLLPAGAPTPKAQRIRRLKNVAAAAGVSRSKAVERVSYGEIVGYAGDFVLNDAKRGEFLWRACSGAAHGDTWAILGLQDRVAVDAVADVQTLQLTVSIPTLSIVTAQVMELVIASFGLFDHRNQPAT